MRTVICGFPGIGKTYFKNHMSKLEVHDSDSSQFHWLENKEPHPEWPNNYIDHIKSLDGIVLCSTHENVLDALDEAGIEYFLVFPMEKAKATYLNRFRNRGSSTQFMERLNENWESWIKGLENRNIPGMRKLRLIEGQTLCSVWNTFVILFGLDAELRT